MGKRYYTIKEANQVLRDRFGYGERTARAIRNDKKYGFPPLVGAPGHRGRYHADKYDQAVDNFEKRWFGC